MLSFRKRMQIEIWYSMLNPIRYLFWYKEKKIKNVSTSKKIFRFRLKLALGAPIFFSKSWNSVEMNNKLKLSKLTWTPQFLFENEIELTDRCTGLFITPMLALIT